MAEAGLSAGQVAGTGKDGRITKGDVLGAAAAPAPAPAAKAAPAPAAAKPALPQVAANR
ncbi:E3 binding domain-containing protein [Cupriavidus basilensis]